MNTRGLVKLLVRILDHSGVMPDSRRGKKRNPIARAHGFRKFVLTNMVHAKLNTEAREMLIDHRIGLSDLYSHLPPIVL